MNNTTHDADTPQARWARFRFSIIGPLLAAPPEDGELKKTLAELAKKQWRHPTTHLPIFFSVSTRCLSTKLSHKNFKLPSRR